MSISSYEYSFQTTPIILVGGVAGAGMLPIVNLLNPQNYPRGVTSPATNDYDFPTFATFRPLPGHTLMENEIATYPLANQTVAANAVITSPLRISIEMLVPANAYVTALDKNSIMTSLKATLDNHTAQGGWYNVVTPSYVYQGCLLTSLADASDDDAGTQPQVRWIWSFVQPLITQEAATAAVNQATAKIGNQTYNAGDPPGSDIAVTLSPSPSSNLVQNLIPAASGALGSNVAPPNSSQNFANLSGIAPVVPTGL
jgi:hypothetical protein